MRKLLSKVEIVIIIIIALLFLGGRVSCHFSSAPTFPRDLYEVHTMTTGDVGIKFVQRK